MPSAKRTRDRQLAKLAARRQAERRAQRRRRELVIGGVLAVAAAVALAVAGTLIFGDDGEQAASPTPSASPSAASVACGGTAPAVAGEQKSTFDRKPRQTIDPGSTYKVAMRTSCGRVEMRLFPETAPEGVNSFVFLARRGFYDGLTFHRIVDGFVIQGGDPEGTGSGGPGYSFDIESDPKVTFDREGLLAYANSGPGTNGSQFFITLAQTDLKSTDYTIFGEVVAGMDVVRRIAAVPAVEVPGGIPGEASSPTQSVFIEKVTVTES